MSAKRAAGKYNRIADGVYERNGVLCVAIWNPRKGDNGGKDWHTLGNCACGRTHPGSTKADAKELKLQLEREKREQRNMLAEMSVDEWVGHYDDERWVSGKWRELRPRPSEGTNIHNDFAVRAFAKEFAGRSLSSITPQEAAEYATRHPATTKEVHAMLNDALAMKLITRNAFTGIRQVAGKGRRDIFVLTDQELQELCDIARAIYRDFGDMFAAMIQTAAWTGLRPGELFLVSLNPDDHINYADVDARVLHVEWQAHSRVRKTTRPKNNSMREVILLPGALDALRSIERTQEPGEVLFRTKQGKPFSQRSFFYYWSSVRDAFVSSRPPGHHLRRRMKAGGVGGNGNFDFYELRHYFGTKLAHPPAGVRPASPQDIAMMMGHKDGGELAMRVYIHTRNEDALDRIGAAWRRAS